MNTKTTLGDHPVNRRQFFRRLAALGGTAAAAGAAGSSGRSVSHPRTAAPGPKAGGYRLTAHIRKYYQKAAV